MCVQNGKSIFGETDNVAQNLIAMELLKGFIDEMNIHRVQMEKEVFSKLGRTLKERTPSDFDTETLPRLPAQLATMNESQIDELCVKVLRQVRDNSVKILARFKELNYIDADFPDVPPFPILPSAQ